MAEMRVQCPGCQAKMKLTSAIEKVRCPRCDELFTAADHRVRPAKPEPSRSTSKQRQPAADPFGFEEEQDDLFGETPARKKSAGSSRQSTSRKRRSRKSKTATIAPEQLRKFGGTMILFGVGAFILPFIGLQIKGLNAMSPEMQTLGGVCFLILGAVLITISYLQDHMGELFDNGFQFVKWGAIGLIALVFGVPLIFIVGRIAMNAIGGAEKKQPEMNRIAEQMHDDAMQRHNDSVQQMQQTHRDMMNASNPGSAPQGDFFNQPASQENSTQQNATNQNTSQAEESDSPFKDVTNFPSSTQQSGNTSTTEEMENPFVATGSTTEPSEMKSPFAVVETEKQTVTVILKGFNRSETIRHMRDLRTAAETFRMRPENIGDGSSRIVFDDVKGIQQFADRIEFGKVTNVDTAKNEITLEK
ncbi:hypothetical protein OAF98_01985 [Planctomicrobium sp.]|nr:hypothetical protein [Planctomicrobium sp.]MDB4743231.1 hypothetical protein [Planctomicrobium sp.]